MVDVPNNHQIIPTFNSYDEILKSGLLEPVEIIRANNYLQRKCADGSEVQDSRQFVVGGYITSTFGRADDENPTTALTVGKRLLPQILALEGGMMSEWLNTATNSSVWELRFLWDIPPKDKLLDYTRDVKPISSFIRGIIAKLEGLSGADMVYELVETNEIEDSPNTGQNAIIYLKNGNKLRIGRYLEINSKLMTDEQNKLASLPNQYPRRIREFIHNNYRKY